MDANPLVALHQPTPNSEENSDRLPQKPSSLPAPSTPKSPCPPSPNPFGDGPDEHLQDENPTTLLAPPPPPVLEAPLPSGDQDNTLPRPSSAVKHRPCPVNTSQSLSLPAAPDSLPRKASSFSQNRNHRKNIFSIDSVPRQTIMKALVSRPPPTSSLSINTT